MQAAYTGRINADGLRSGKFNSLTEPYSLYPILLIYQLASGGGETIPSSILASTGTGNDIVDWGFAQLHRTSDGAVILTRAVLIKEMVIG
ncbi:MAG: hypothetical protein IPP79_03675 [Chitinophagaceae bacterium]|nr:hypothetical protein [Chitinophagaceae bacterium]